MIAKGHQQKVYLNSYDWRLPGGKRPVERPASGWRMKPEGEYQSLIATILLWN